jgi:hypothetical protein
MNYRCHSRFLTHRRRLSSNRCSAADDLFPNACSSGCFEWSPISESLKFWTFYLSSYSSLSWISLFSRPSIRILILVPCVFVYGISTLSVFRCPCATLFPSTPSVYSIHTPRSHSFRFILVPRSVTPSASRTKAPSWSLKIFEEFDHLRFFPGRPSDNLTIYNFPANLNHQLDFEEYI